MSKAESELTEIHVGYRRDGTRYPAAQARVENEADAGLPRALRIDLKRCLDLVGTLVLLAVFALPMLVTFILVRASGGSALFKQTRVGRGGETFTCYKFRTMVPNAQQVLERLLENDPQAREQWQRDQKLRDDPRITRIGALLRRTSLDELPQLFNVLKGEMSLVGPRPVLHEELLRYGSRARYYLSIKPGLTGLWQVSGRNDLRYSRRVALDVFYVKNHRLSFDVWILWRTVGVVLRGCGAY